MLKAPKLNAFLLKNGFNNNIYQCNALLSALVKSCRLDEALNLISASPATDSRSFNIVVSGLARERRFTDAIAQFLQMRHISGTVKPDNYTYAIVIPCCGFELGRQIHAEVVKVCSVNSDAFVGTSLIRLYGEKGEMEGAGKVFDEMLQRDLVAWNALISCYAKSGMGGMSFRVFRRLLLEGVVADEFTYATVLNAAEVFEAMQVHSLVVRCGFCLDRFTCNALVNLYSKSGLVECAIRLFEEMPVVDEVSWTAMIVGLSRSGFENHAMKLFGQMRLARMDPNSFTFGGLFNACATSNSYKKGQQLHSLALKFGLETDIVVGSAMLDMYSKCGGMNDASKIFQLMPEKDLACWNAMICGFSQNGEGMKVLNLFEQMVQQSRQYDQVAPNDVTFIGVLSACSNSGLVREGYRYFSDMVNEYLIEPKAEHYTCMVDILAKAGLLEEAEALVLAMPFKPDNVMWGVLLGACKLHGNQDMAKRAAERLLADEPGNSSNYVLLANMYTAISEWENAAGVREAMDDGGLKKMRGCSWTEIKNHVYSFVAGHKHYYDSQIEPMYEALYRLHMHMEDICNYRNFYFTLGEQEL